MIDHACVENLGFKIKIVTLLAGVGHSKELRYLVLAIVKDRFKIRKSFGLYSADQPGVRGLDFDARPPDIDGTIPAELFDHVGEEVAGMAGVRCSPDACSDEHHS
jgi:hypothetical protein